MIGYLWYISVHHVVHHWHPGHSGYVYGLKRRHALHHHFDDAANFGVTSGSGIMCSERRLDCRPANRNIADDRRPGVVHYSGTP